MKLREWIAQVETAFPPAYALGDDPIGLHVGDTAQPIQTVYVALEASTALLEKAIAAKTDVLFVHHPLIFRPLPRLTQSDPVQALIRTMVKHDIALYAAHTNVDLHPKGMAKTWASLLGCTSAKPLLPKPQSGMIKLITFVPATHTQSLREALSNAGAGHIGNYEQCSFSTKGTGTFFGNDESEPFSGNAGALEQVDEDRLEMVFPAPMKSRVIRALHESHPYDEVAFDLIRMDDFKDLGHAIWLAEFPEALSWGEFRSRVEDSLRVPPTWMECTPAEKPVQRIAISTGSGNSMLRAVGGLGVDAYLTGELGYHQLWEANERGLNTLVVGHDASEAFFAETVTPPLQHAMPELTWVQEHA